MTDATRIDGVAETSVQHRCPRMREHVTPGRALTVPCPDCYAVRVAVVRIPYEPPTGWRPVGFADNGTVVVETTPGPDGSTVTATTLTVITITAPDRSNKP